MNNNNHTTTLALFFAGWAVMCLACSGGGASGSSPAATGPTPTPDMSLPPHIPTHPYTDPAIGVYFNNMWKEGHLRPPDRVKDIPPGTRPMTDEEVEAEYQKPKRGGQAQ